jgi:hypothetical protein
VNVVGRLSVRQNAFDLFITPLRRREPCLKVMFLNGDDGALVSGGSYFGRRFIRDGRKGIQARLPALRPVIPEASDEHVACWLRIELQDEVFLLFAGRKLTMLIQVFGDILVEAADDEDGVLATVYPTPRRSTS